MPSIFDFKHYLYLNNVHNALAVSFVKMIFICAYCNFAVFSIVEVENAIEVGAISW